MLLTGPAIKKTTLLKLALVALAAWFVSIQVPLDIAAMMQAVSPSLLTAALAIQPFLFAATLLNAFRHALLISYPRARLRPCVSAVLLSAGLNLLIPGRVTEIVKATYLQRQLSIPLSNGTAAIVIERLLDLCVVSAIGFVGIFGVYLSNSQPIFLLFLTTALCLICFRPLSIYLLPRLKSGNSRFHNFIKGNLQHVGETLTWRRHLSSLTLTVLSWSVHLVAIWIFFWLLPDYSLSPAEAALVFGAIIFAGALPGLPGGIGAVQAAVTFALTQIGIPFEESLVVSIVLHVAEVLISATCAPFILVTQPTGISDLLRRPSSKIEPE